MGLTGAVGDRSRRRRSCTETELDRSSVRTEKTSCHCAGCFSKSSQKSKERSPLKSKFCRSARSSAPKPIAVTAIIFVDRERVMRDSGGVQVGGRKPSLG